MNDLATFRTETRAWLEANCPPSMRTNMKHESEAYWGGRNATFISDEQQQWFEAMASRGWTAPAWPAEYGGGGLSKEENKILQQEMRRLNCRKPLLSFGIWMLGPALLRYGSEAQKHHYIPDIVQGKIRWCQGYSEPNAGSDLASLGTSAEDRGDHYLVNGQKVWTSYADKADWIFCLVRTEPDAPKHSGISFVLIDMESEGVSVRPIKLISGKSPFCETFFDNVKVPKHHLVGTENKGWTIAKYLLTHERGMIGGIGDTENKQALHEFALQQIGTEHGKLADPILRQQVAQIELDAWAYQLTLERAADEAKAGHGPGAKSSFYKYYGTELNKARFEAMVALGGTESFEWEGPIASHWLRTKGNSIEGGTSEIQLNIISKHLLGLPSK